MMNFDLAFTFTIGNEGSQFTNDPDDPGGPTKFGVTQKTYAEFLGRSVSVEEIENLTIQNAKQYYQAVYWIAIHLDLIASAAVSIAIFDTAVLYGPATASVMAQKVATLFTGDALKLDGVIGDKTAELLNELDDEDFLKAYQTQILGRINMVISSNPKLEKFRKGWTSRAERLLTLTDLNSLIKLQA